MTDKATGKVAAVNRGASTVDVFALGGVIPGLPYPAWYAPSVGDQVILDWVGSQAYVASVSSGLSALSPGVYVSGASYSSPHTSRSTAAPSINTGGAIPFWCGQARQWSSMGIEVTTAATAGGLCRLGVYADGGGYPGNLLATPGSVPTTATGTQTVSFPSPFTLTPGIYWLGFQIEVAAATLRSVNGSVASLLGLQSPAGGSVMDGLYGTTGWVAGAMPAPFPAGLSQTPNLPLVFITAT